jgi:hypothetical protein
MTDDINRLLQYLHGLEGDGLMTINVFTIILGKFKMPVSFAILPITFMRRRHTAGSPYVHPIADSPGAGTVTGCQSQVQPCNSQNWSLERLTAWPVNSSSDNMASSTVVMLSVQYRS